MTTKHKHAELIIAWANGATIQVKDAHGLYTDLAHSPSWALPEGHYRIKPQPKEVWINIYPDNKISNGYPTKDEADWIGKTISKRIACIKVAYTEGDGLEAVSPGTREIN